MNNNEPSTAAKLERAFNDVAQPVAFLHLPGVDGDEYSDAFEIDLVYKQSEALQELLVKYSDSDGVTIPLYAAPQEPAAPEGWQLVPIEPTSEMITYAGRESIGLCDHEKLTRVYKAMIAAAPVHGDAQ